MDLKNVPERIAYLILLYLHGKLTAMDRKELDAWILEAYENEILFDDAINFNSDE